MDHTSVPTKMVQVGKGHEKQGIGRSRDGYTTKMHAVVDAFVTQSEFI